MGSSGNLKTQKWLLTLMTNCTLIYKLFLFVSVTDEVFYIPWWVGSHIGSRDTE